MQHKPLGSEQGLPSSSGFGAGALAGSIERSMMQKVAKLLVLTERDGVLTVLIYRVF